MTPDTDTLEALLAKARAFVADAMRELGESYPPAFATYVAEGVPSASASVLVDTAVVAVSFALLDAQQMIAVQAARIAEMEAALGWYAEQTAGCRKITGEGHDARVALDTDGGKRARTALQSETGT